MAEVTEREAVKGMPAPPERVAGREWDFVEAVMDGAGITRWGLLDREFNFVGVSHAWAASFGCHPQELVGKNFFNAHPRSEHRASFVRARDTGETVHYRDQLDESPGDGQGGVGGWDCTLTPVKDAVGEVRQLVVALLETHKAAGPPGPGSPPGEAAELERLRRDLEQFAYAVSHDLQEPLRTMCSFSELLARLCRGKLDREGEELIGYIVAGGQRMQKMIKDLLAFARLGTRGGPLGMIDSGEIVRTALKNLDAAIAESGAVIECDPLPRVLGDPVQLLQLFQNVLGNAIKFRRPDQAPRLRIWATHLDGAWQFSVSDNGIGIDPQFSERIFDVFQRLHARSEYEGNGMGLAICKRIVERHGGRIWVESEPGRGATFHFTLNPE